MLADVVLKALGWSSPEPWRIWATIAALVTMGIFCLWVSADARAFLRRGVGKFRARTDFNKLEEQDWKALCERAAGAIETAIAELPADIRAEAKEVPYLFEERAEKEPEGFRTLGRYHNFTPGRKSDYKGPIFLYLRSIQEHCLANRTEYEEKVRTTYLHELGHHFGWDEFDLARVGLPTGRMPGE
jgi:predicted Zn-dependent protease with MMP-like domain